MTIILSYQSGTSLVMAGDLMLSANTPLTSPILLPTRSKEPTTNQYLVGLEQKVLLVNPHLAVAWAGNRMVARSIILELAKLTRDEYSGPNALAVIQSLGLLQEEQDEVGLIIWMLRRDDLIEVQDFNVKQVEAGPSTKMKFIGSGDFHFFEQIGFALKTASGQPNEFDQSISAVVGRIAIALFHELTCDVTHDLFYGGGFEVIIPDSTIGAFRKLPLSFAVWGYNDHEIWLAGPVFNQIYDPNGVLGLRRFVVENGAWQQTIFPVGNFLADAAKASFDPTSNLETGYSVHYFVEKGASTFSHIQRQHETSLNMHLSEQGQIVTRFSPEFMREFYICTEPKTEQSTGYR